MEVVLVTHIRHQPEELSQFAYENLIKKIFIKAFTLLLVNLCFAISFSQNCNKEKFSLYKLQNKEQVRYYFVNHEFGLIRELNKEKYITSLTTHINSYFAIFSLNKSQGWYAVDFNENILFEVFNYVRNEPTPDFLTENRIRIINDDGKIGFANKCGKIIIKPKFDWVTHFYSGKAIFGDDCSLKEQNGFFSFDCKKYGVINANGEIIEKYESDSFSQVQEKIEWKNKRVTN